MPVYLTISSFNVGLKTSVSFKERHWRYDVLYIHWMMPMSFPGRRETICLCPLLSMLLCRQARLPRRPIDCLIAGIQDAYWHPLGGGGSQRRPGVFEELQALEFLLFAIDHLEKAPQLAGSWWDPAQKAVVDVALTRA